MATPPEQSSEPGAHPTLSDAERARRAEGLLAEAKKLFSEDNALEEALARDLEAAEIAPGTLCALRGYRFAGLCCYRLDRFDEALKWFTKAEILADRLDARAEALFVANHRGAVLRRMDRPDLALAEFTAALQKASEWSEARARTRLLGNLGALYDEMGQRALADEHYARYEERCLDGGDQRSLANALGLMGRVELLRERLDEAARRFDRELQIATQTKIHDRLFTAYRHQAMLRLARARLARDSGVGAAPDLERKKLLDEAEDWYRRAERCSTRDGVHRRVMVARGHAEVAWLRDQPVKALARLAGALRELDQAGRGEDGGRARRLLEPRAKVLEDIGRIAHALNLNGEALHYLCEAIEARDALLSFPMAGEASPLGAADPEEEIRALYAPRFEELSVLLERVLEQAETVPRDREELDRLRRVMVHLGHQTAEIDDKLARLKGAAALTAERREEAEQLWAKLMGAAAFERLADDSRADLVRSQIVYHGAVDDLGRSAHLVVVVFERELRRRFLKPVIKLWRKGRGWQWKPSFRDGANRLTRRLPLPKVLELVQIAVWTEGEPLEDRRASFSGDFPDAMRKLCLAWREPLKAVLRLGDKLTPLGGEGLDAIDIRNQVAHGRYEPRLPTRLDVDAFRRLLIIGPDSPLAKLSAVGLCVEDATALRDELMNSTP